MIYLQISRDASERRVWQCAYLDQDSGSVSRYPCNLFEYKKQFNILLSVSRQKASEIPKIYLVPKVFSINRFTGEKRRCSFWIHLHWIRLLNVRVDRWAGIGLISPLSIFLCKALILNGSTVKGRDPTSIAYIFTPLEKKCDNIKPVQK